MPENRHNAHQHADQRRANTFSGSHPNSVDVTSQTNIPPIMATIEAHQESSASGNNHYDEEHPPVSSLHSLSLGPACRSQQQLKQQYDSASLESYSKGERFQYPPNEQSLTSASRPHHYHHGHTVADESNLSPHPGSYVSLHSDQDNSVFETSITQCHENLSASSSLFEMAPHAGHYAPVIPKWQFPSNPSSGNVSQENMLNSSHSDIMESAVTEHSPMSLQSAFLYQTGNLQGQRQWYHSSSLVSLPADQFPGTTDSNFTSMQPRILSTAPRRPIRGRSMSQEYYHPRSMVGRRRRNTLNVTPGSGYFTPFHGGPAYSPRASIWPPVVVPRGLPQNQYYLPHTATHHYAHNQGPHHGQLGEVSGPLSLPTDYSTVVPVSYAPPHTLVGQMSSTSSNGKVKRGWPSGEYRGSNLSSKPSTKLSTLEHESLLQHEDQSPTEDHRPFHDDSKHSSIRKHYPEFSDVEHKPQLGMICGVEEKNHDHHLAESLSNERTTSNRSLASMNTLTSSLSKSPVGSPPMIRNRGQSLSCHSVLYYAINYFDVFTLNVIASWLHTHCNCMGLLIKLLSLL